MVRLIFPTEYVVAFAIGGAIGLLPPRVMTRGTIAAVAIVAVWATASIAQDHVHAGELLARALDAFTLHRALLIASCAGWAMAAIAARARATT